MPISIDQELLREIILDHHKNPRNFQEVDDPNYVTIHMDSASCIDDIYIHLLAKDGKIIDCKWHGNGCAISTASTSIMTELVIGKSEEEALAIMDDFYKMLKGDQFDDELLGEAICFVNVNRQPSRITCADISWRGLKKAIAKEEDDEQK